MQTEEPGRKRHRRQRGVWVLPVGQVLGRVSGRRDLLTLAMALSGSGQHRFLHPAYEDAKALTFM